MMLQHPKLKVKATCSCYAHVGYPRFGVVGFLIFSV